MNHNAKWSATTLAVNATLYFFKFHISQDLFSKSIKVFQIDIFFRRPSRGPWTAPPPPPARRSPPTTLRPCSAARRAGAAPSAWGRGRAARGAGSSGASRSGWSPGGCSPRRRRRRGSGTVNMPNQVLLTIKVAKVYPQKQKKSEKEGGKGVLKKAFSSCEKKTNRYLFLKKW